MSHFVCICCGREYINNGHDFHKLCHECFTEFDNQKMRGRLSQLGLADATLYYASAKEFVNSKQCTHKEDSASKYIKEQNARSK